MIRLDKECQELLNKLQQYMGRNLMLFNAIESSLKLMLPYTNIEGSQESVGSKDKINVMTLGALIKKYLGCLKIKSGSTFVEDSVIQEFYKKEFKKIVDSRNQLVYTFFTIPGIDTYTKKGLENGLHYLDQQYHEVVTFHKENTAPILLIQLELYREINPQVTGEIQQLCELLSQFAEGRCTVYDRDYTDIIDLLQSAEQALPKIKGMTSLSQAGQFIKTKNPNFNPNLYERKNLKSILIDLDLFEILEIPHKNGNAKTVLYRTKPLSSSCEY
ncbi:MAG: OST-HTH/LOTUS domain-containing protein [Candidatus Competibacteraceae bacterium]